MKKHSFGYWFNCVVYSCIGFCGLTLTFLSKNDISFHFGLFYMLASTILLNQLSIKEELKCCRN